MGNKSGQGGKVTGVQWGRELVHTGHVRACGDAWCGESVGLHACMARCMQCHSMSVWAACDQCTACGAYSGTCTLWANLMAVQAHEHDVVTEVALEGQGEAPGEERGKGDKGCVWVV